MPDKEPKRLPLAVSPENRDETTNRDAKLINGYVEQVGENAFWVYKRPGLGVYSTVTAAQGLGVYNWLGDIYAIWGNKLYKNGVAVAGTVDTTGGVYTLDACLGATPKLFLHNGVGAYCYDSTNGLVAIPASVFISATGRTSSGSAVITEMSSITGLVVGQYVTGSGIPAGAKILTIDSSTQITLDQKATASKAGVELSFSNKGIVEARVKGAPYLDGTTYVMNASANIYGSGINDQTSWDPLNMLVAQIEPDAGVRLAKQLVYVIAFKQWSVEVFYDAGNATGSPLGPVQGAKVNVGCKHQDSVRELDGTLFWISQARNGGVSVMAMEGLKASQVSTPAIERLLQQADYSTVYSWAAKVAGHKYYAVTLPASKLTLVYDVISRRWYQWTDANGNYLPIVSSTFSADQQPLLQHASNGKIYKLEMTNTTDDGELITMDLYLPNYDGGTRLTKYLHSMDIVADQTNGSLLQIRKSDDDYQTWSNFRTVDLGNARPRLTQGGSFRRRAYHFRHACNTPLRITSVEIQVELGTL